MCKVEEWNDSGRVSRRSREDTLLNVAYRDVIYGVGLLCRMYIL